MSAMRNSKPHVVIIMADQLRYDALGAHTPNLNQLKSESSVFEKAYCASPLCVPARGAFFTGKYPNVTGALHNAKIPQEKQFGMVRRDHASMYELMEEQWDSWHTGKMDFRTERRIEHSPDSKTNWLPLEPRYYEFLEKHGKRRPGGESFRGRVPETAYGKVTRTQVVSTPQTGRYEEGLEYFYDGFILNDTLHALKNRDTSKPLLLNAMFFAPHPPIDIPDPYYSKVDQFELPANVGVWGSNQSPLQLYNLTGVLGAGMSRNDWRDVWQVYLGFVSLLDDCVGQVIDELKKQGIYDDTLILFTSDHGEMLGSHRLWQKMCMYEESVRTPLFVKFPAADQREKRIIDESVSSVDVLPTLCDYLGLGAAGDFSGKSLMPLLDGLEAGRTGPVFIQYDGNGSSSNSSRAVVDRHYKLIVDFFKDELFIELYHLESDEQEMVNLAFEDEHRGTVEQLLGLLRRHMEETGDVLTIPEDAFQQFGAVYREFKV